MVIGSTFCFWKTREDLAELQTNSEGLASPKAAGGEGRRRPPSLALWLRTKSFHH